VDMGPCHPARTGFSAGCSSLCLASWGGIIRSSDHTSLRVSGQGRGPPRRQVELEILPARAPCSAAAADRRAEQAHRPVGALLAIATRVFALGNVFAPLWTVGDRPADPRAPARDARVEQVAFSPGSHRHRDGAAAVAGRITAVPGLSTVETVPWRGPASREPLASRWK